MSIHHYLQASGKISLDFIQENYLEHRDLKVLELIYIHFRSSKTCLTVNDVIGTAHLGSRATIHRGLHRMRESGVIDFFNQSGNYRTKYLKPSSIADEYFRKLEKSMLAESKLPRSR
jgi:hypothetical protein